MEVRKAAASRATAITGPNIPQVSATASTSDSGVEIRKESIAGWLAPFRCRAIDSGTMPQLQIGSGMPRSAARAAAARPLPPIHRTIARCGRNTCRTPASSRPKRMNGAARYSVCQTPPRIAAAIFMPKLAMGLKRAPRKDRRFPFPGRIDSDSAAVRFRTSSRPAESLECRSHGQGPTCAMRFSGPAGAAAPLIRRPRRSLCALAEKEVIHAKPTRVLAAGPRYRRPHRSLPAAASRASSRNDPG